MCCSFRHAQILTRRFPTAIAIHSSIWVAPSQRGENHRTTYVHVPAARMSSPIHIAMAISGALLPLTKHPLFQLFSGTGAKIGASPTLLFTSVTGGFWGKPTRGTFRVRDARSTPVLISPGAPRFQEFPVASISICIGPINIPIIKFPVNRPSHQPSSISQSGTPTHIPTPIPIFLIFASSFFSTGISSETRQIIPSFYFQRKSQ